MNHSSITPNAAGATQPATYRPKAVRGLSYPGYIRINKAQLGKLFSADPAFLFSGFIVGNNVNSFHFFGGWHLACRLEKKTAEEMRETINSFLCYLDSELGNNAAIFLAKSALNAPAA